MVPPLSCDCHFHIFGPFDRFPLDAGRHYTPPTALVADYRAAVGGLGFARMVVVQPSPYGTDNRCTLDAVAQFGAERARAVAVIDDGFDTGALSRLHAAGVRGVRFNLVSGNGTPADRLPALAARIAPFGWHIQVYADGETLAAMAPQLAALPVDVVIDHCGGVRAALGTAHPQFQALLRLLGSGRAWVKLSSYRASSAGAPWDDMAPNVRALAAAAPERCLWGTDWPHTQLAEPPTPTALLRQFLSWLPDPAHRQRILADNPAQLYGFAPQ